MIDCFQWYIFHRTRLRREFCHGYTYESTMKCIYSYSGIKNTCWLQAMGLLSDSWNCGLRMCRECRERFPRHRLQRMHVGIDNPRWRGKRSRQSRCMRSPPFYVSDKRTIAKTLLKIKAYLTVGWLHENFKQLPLLTCIFSIDVS